MKFGLIIILILSISSISCLKQSPGKLQKILKGTDSEAKFAEQTASSFLQTETTTGTEAQSEVKAKQDEEEGDPYELMADELTKSREDPEIRKIKAGQLSNFYPKAQREQASKYAAEKKKNGHECKNIVSPYRFCLFPYSEINAMTYCENTFKKISPTRAMECKHMMCINCCNHLQLILKYVTSQSIVSEVLGLADDSGYNKIKGYVTNDVIKSCRLDCVHNYPIVEPIVLPPPPNDPELGSNPEAPGESCIDIMLNGGKPESGIYQVKKGDKPPISVYCDQVTDNGGWTLFLAYSHHPYEDYQVDSTELPTDPVNGRSHMALEQLGFTAKDVTELRFFCTSDHFAKEPRYIHFKSKNPDLFKVALTGDQQFLKPKSFQNEASPLELPDDPKYAKHVPDKSYMNANQVGSAKGGHFYLNLWESETGAWSIKGKAKNGGKWQCGDLLDVIDGANYETLHQVWFRGIPPTKEELEERFLEKQNDN